jgi:hypothetical protein
MLYKNKKRPHWTCILCTKQDSTLLDLCISYENKIRPHWTCTFCTMRDTGSVFEYQQAGGTQVRCSKTNGGRGTGSVFETQQAGVTQVRCSETNGGRDTGSVFENQQRAGHRFGVRKPTAGGTQVRCSKTNGRDTGSVFENQRRAGHRFGVRKPTTVPTSNFVFFVRGTATGPGCPDAGFVRRLVMASALQGEIRALRKHDNGRNT